MEVKDLFDIWLVSDEQREFKASTRQKYKSNIKNYLYGTALAGMLLSEVKKTDIAQYTRALAGTYSERRKKQLAGSTINNMEILLRQVFNFAVEMDYIDVSPVGKLKKYPTENYGQKRALTKEEQRLVENKVCEIGDIYLYPVILCLYTGIRIGEVCALKWSDISLEEEEIYIRRDCYSGIVNTDTGKWGIIIDKPKTETSERMVPLPTFIAEDLKRIKQKANPDGYVFEWKGGYLPPWDLRYRFDKVTKALGITDISFHELRHTFCTKALEAGMDIRTLAEIIGHCDPSFTLDVYSHSSMENKRKAVEQIKSPYKKR